MQESQLEPAIDEINSLRDVLYRGSNISDIIAKRIEEFKTLGTFGRTHFNFHPFLDLELDTDIFGELCFCILTANSSAELGIRIQKEIGIEGFKELSEVQISEILLKMGHRYPSIRAKYIFLARSFDLQRVLKQGNGKLARQILLGVKGLGMKESSHFLRNIGYDDVAIVDRHIYRFLVRHKLVQYKESITPNLYLECERILEKISRISQIPLSALDLYIFYKQAGTVLK